VVLAVLVVAGGLYLLLGRTRPEMPVEPPAHRSTSTPSPSPPAPVAETTRVPSPTKNARPAPSDAVVRGPDAVSAAIRKRDLLVAAHVQQAIVEADERAFSRLALADDQRVAIRLLNERYAHRMQGDLAAQRGDLLPEQQFGNTIAITENGERTRRAELVQLLGAVTAESFQRAEAAEVRRLQRHYRVQWAEELDENAPLPPDLPPRAH
jgi:hypothetical protein